MVRLREALVLEVLTVHQERRLVLVFTIRRRLLHGNHAASGVRIPARPLVYVDTGCISQSFLLVQVLLTSVVAGASGRRRTFGLRLTDLAIAAGIIRVRPLQLFFMQALLDHLLGLHQTEPLLLLRLLLAVVVRRLLPDGGFPGIDDRRNSLLVSTCAAVHVGVLLVCRM